MSEEQIPPRKAPCAFGTLEWLFLCVRSLMALQVLKSSKGSSACRTYVGSWFVGLWRWEVDVAVLGTVQGLCMGTS